LNSRFNSPLFRSPQSRKPRHARAYSWVPLTAAAAVTAGALGAAGVTAGTVPWTEAVAGITGTAHAAPGTSAGQSGSPVVSSVIAMRSRAAAAGPWRPQAVGSAQPDSQDVSAADALTVPAALSAVGHEGSALAGGSPRQAHPQTAASSAAAHAPAGTVLTVGAQAQDAHAGTAQDHAGTAQGKVNQASTAHASFTQLHAAQARQARARSARKSAQAGQRQPPAAQAAPYLIYDSVMPAAIPANQRVATYANGPYAASSAAAAGREPVLWIDTDGSDPAASALDVEPGDATPAGAAQWVQQKLAAQPNSIAIVYTMQSEWQQVKDNIAALPGWMQSRVRYWIADPTGVPHVVPGSSATQWYWGSTYDITTANPDFQAS
jgi:hypothetical protein